MSVKKWDRLGSRTVYRNKWISLSQESFRLPSNKRIEYSVVHTPDFVAALALHNKKIIMVRQYRPAVDDITLELPAGGADGDGVIAAGLRELEEETGYHAKSAKKLLTFYPFVGRARARVHVIFASNLAKTGSHQDEYEFIDVVKVDPKAALRYIESGKICVGHSVAGILYASRKGLI